MATSLGFLGVVVLIAFLLFGVYHVVTHVRYKNDVKISDDTTDQGTDYNIDRNGHVKNDKE